MNGPYFIVLIRDTPNEPKVPFPSITEPEVKEHIKSVIVTTDYEEAVATGGDIIQTDKLTTLLSL